MARISVIVPVFNTRQYLEECIGSILAQTYGDFELILVDDGSSDDSLSVCRSYEERDERVKVIHQENQGQMVATRNGVDASCGEYLSFIDSDDYIRADMYENMMAEVERHHPDIVTMAGCAFDGKRMKSYADMLEPGFYDRRAIESYVIPSMFSNHSLYGRRGIHSSKALKLFRRQLFADVIHSVPDDVQMGEDMLCTYTCVVKASSLSILPRDKIGYMYRLNPASISWVYKRNLFARSMKLCSSLRNIPEVRCDERFQKEVDYEVCFFTINAFYNEYLMKNDRTMSQRRRSVQEMIASHEFRSAVSSIDIGEVRNPNRILLKLMCRRNLHLIYLVGSIISILRRPVLYISQKVV